MFAHHSVNALVCGLDDELAAPLVQLLRPYCHIVKLMSHVPGSTGAVASPDVIFCPADVSNVRTLRSMSPESSIIVASRMPEVNGWLDALDAGAVDYCAAPFETAQIRWMLESHARHV